MQADHGTLADLAAHFVDAALPYKATIWGGIGVGLCFWGGRMRYTALFFPLIRIADLRALADLEEELGKVLQALPRSFIGKTAQTLLLSMVARSMNPATFAEVLSSGLVASVSLGLMTNPSELAALKLAQWRSLLRESMRKLRLFASTTGASMARNLGADRNGCLTAQLVATQLVGIGDMWLVMNVDQPWSLMVNCALGAQLLRCAANEYLPEPGPVTGFCLDALSAGVGLVGLLWQARKLGLLDKPRQLLQTVEGFVGRLRSTYEFYVDSGDADL
eukprot:TRINITY_DN31765_c0_g1_i2.p1 TRINITY_DN31765_c0_g1~~TRINITY_DN31765_c0_g1_i2.p1  ORF type:complete len:276 (+),score=28.48 TRINITY_DN31765_c0_g1_i2:105-932(+)